MREFLRIASGVNVAPIVTELFRQPALWGDYRARQDYAGSPHHGSDDIWLRGRCRSELLTEQSFTERHTPVFWPAWHALPSVRPLVFALMAQEHATELGAVLMTRLPPGGTIQPHADIGGWHAAHYRHKLHVTLAGSSLSTCGSEAVTMQAGEIWAFDNLHVHSVENRGDTDRIVCIVAMRCE